MAQAYNLAVVYTSQAIANPQMFGVDVKPVGGFIAGHGATTGLWLRKGSKGIRIIKLTKSPWREEGEVTFRINQTGIIEAEETTE
jgi:RecA/RadA recombinase